MVIWFLRDYTKLPALPETEFINKENYGMLKEAMRHQIHVVFPHMSKAIHQQTGVPRILLLRAVICQGRDSNVQSPHMANNAQTNPGGVSARGLNSNTRAQSEVSTN